MKSSYNIKLIFPFIFLIIICSSFQPQPVKKNFADLYNPVASFLHPKYIVFNKSNEISTLIVNINSKELLFNEANASMTPQAEISIIYKLTNISTKLIEDSATINIVVSREDARDELVSFVPVKARFGNKYLLQIEIIDVKRKNSHKSSIIVNKTDITNRQNFLLREFPSTAPIFNSFIDSTTSFYIEYPYAKVDSYIVKFYNNNFEIATSPSSLLTITDRFDKPDSVFIWRIADSNYFRINKKGFYVFQISAQDNSGIGISYFSQSFPRVTKADELFEQIRYITNEGEFNDFLKIKNRKLAVDSFWLKIADDNKELARELIRIYYNRAYLSNLYFTSYKEGWKTDRGMIYIIYGLPDYIYRSDNTERWIYYDEITGEDFFFKFNKIEHPYTDNHYILVRSENLSTHWREAISSWRNGRIYSTNE